MPDLIVRYFPVLPYLPTWQAMKEFASVQKDATDEFWVLQHESVYTKGVRCKENALSQGKKIPSVAVDRGGLMTYHGPGQLVIYSLIDIKRKSLNIKQVVNFLEEAVIKLLGQYDLAANRIEGAPGIYLGQKKIAQIGLRVKNNRTYHGLSVNFDMDLAPFKWIKPCGFEDLEVIQLKDYSNAFDWHTAQRLLISELIQQFDYNCVSHQQFSDFCSSLDFNKFSLSSVPMSIQSPS